MFRSSLVFAVSLLVAVAVQADPQPGTAGRLPDGRAYRIDDQGLKLVDHIAELEATVLELRGEVTALENEVIDRDKQIQSLKSSSTQKLPTAVPATASQTVSPVLQTQNRELTARVQELERTIANLNGQLQQESSRSAGLQQQIQSSQSEQARNSAAIQQQLQEKQSLISASEKNLNNLQEQIVEQSELATTLDAELKSVKAELARTQGELQTAQSDLSQRQEREKELLAQLSEAESGLIEQQQIAARRAAEQRASLSREVPAPAATDQIEPVRNQDSLQVEKQRLNSQLAQIQQLIHQRKSLADSAKAKGRGVSVSMQPLVAKNGASLDRLRSQVSQLSADSNVASIRKGLGDIEKILKDDIGVFSRLSKI